MCGSCSVWAPPCAQADALLRTAPPYCKLELEKALERLERRPETRLVVSITATLMPLLLHAVREGHEPGGEGPLFSRRLVRLEAPTELRATP